MDTFGDKLKRARERKGYSQTEVFKRTKINNKTLSRYEKGGSEPDYETLKILSSLYEVNIEDLIGSGENPLIKEGTEADKLFLEEYLSYDEKKKEKLRKLMEVVREE